MHQGNSSAVVAVFLAASLSASEAAATSPPHPAPSPNWDKCAGSRLNLTAESIYAIAIREFERQVGPLAPDKHHIAVANNGCSWRVTIRPNAHDDRGSYIVIVDEVTGKASSGRWDYWKGMD
jgi:hypothetical protein